MVMSFKLDLYIDNIVKVKCTYSYGLHNGQADFIELP